MKVKCRHCTEEHDLLGMEPSYARPDAALGVPVETVFAEKNLCAVGSRGSDGKFTKEARYFVRTLVPFEVRSPTGALMRSERGVKVIKRHWGIWVEVTYADFEKVLDLWNDPDQLKAEPIPAKIANSVKGYVRTCWPPADPETLGLEGTIRFVDPEQIPHFMFNANTTGPFLAEVREGMSMERYAEVLLKFLHGEG